MKQLLSIFVVALMLLSVGCSGPKMVQVSGQVTLDGEPLDDATIQFDKKDGSLPKIVKIKDGKFSGMVEIGPKTVRFFAMREIETGPDAPGGLRPPHENILHEKYGFMSDIKMEIESSGHSDLRFELESIVEEIPIRKS